MNLADRIDVVCGDITLMKVDAIVNAANTSLLGGGGVDGAIHRAAGPMLLEECKKLGGCPTGEARITGGYDLDAKYVIHTVGPVYGGRPEDAVLLKSCYYNSLLLAEKSGVRTIAFPAISCGVYGYPIAEAAQLSIATVTEFLKSHDSLLKVYFVLFSEKDTATYKTILPELL